MHSPRVEESTPQNHDGLAGGLFQLHLDAGELFVNYLNHPLDLLWRDGPGTTLLPQQIHHVRGELVTRLKRDGNPPQCHCDRNVASRTKLGRLFVDHPGPGMKTISNQSI